MPIDEEINLDDPNGITSEDISRMDEEADYLERIAQNAEDSAEKIAKAKKIMEGMNMFQLNILEKTLETPDSLKTGDGEKDEEDGEDGDGKGITKLELLRMIIEIREELEKSKDERDKNKEGVKKNEKKLTEAEKHRLELEKKIAKVEGSIQSGTNEMLNLRNSPMSFGKNKIMSIVGKAGIYGAIAMFAYEMIQQAYGQIMKEIKQMFGAGGAFDVRKTVLDEMNQVANMKHMIDVNQGTVFFTSDTGEILRQGVPQTSNTRERMNGHKQYQQEFDK